MVVNIQIIIEQVDNLHGLIETKKKMVAADITDEEIIEDATTSIEKAKLVLTELIELWE